MLWPSIALAHDAGHAAASSPSGWDLAVLGLLSAGGLLYALGSWRMAQRGARVRPVERVAFWVGWAALVFAVAPPMDRAAAWRFSSHMTQHELLMLVGAPLVVVGRPVTPWLIALPLAWRPRAAAGLQNRAIGGAWRTLTTPAVAWALHGLVIWVWHVPALYEAAVRSEAVHAFQHGTFVGTAILFWWGLVYGRYGRAAYGASVLFVFVTALHTGILGALFTFSGAPFYPLYAERAAARGVDALTDQQLAGLVMWIPAGVILMLFGLGLLLAWLSEAERRERHRQEARRRAGVVPVLLAGLVLPGLASGCGMPHEEEARRLTGGDPHRGRERIRQYGCDSCHTIPGVLTADATVGPPLTAIARRTYLAGRLANTPENMLRWIRDPQSIEPGNAMPDMGVSERDGRDIVAYLYTLR